MPERAPLAALGCLQVPAYALYMLWVHVIHPYLTAPSPTVRAEEGGG